MSRLPIRRQVTLAFAAALALVLIGVGAFLYLRFENELSSTVDAGLRSRADEIGALIRESGGALDRPGAPRLVEDDESFAQVLDASGRVVDASSRSPEPLLTDAELERARSGVLSLEREKGPIEGEPTRLLATPVRAGGELSIVVVGTALDDYGDALRTLLVLELIGFLAALALASAAGYWVSGIALRPVEAMRRQAQEISGEPGRRLPQPPVDDELGRLGRTLNEMLGRLDSALAAQREALAKERRFVADASHELRTPLTVLRSEVEVALLSERDREELRDALVSAGEEAERLTRLTDDLLVLARADEGEQAVRAEPVRLRELLETVAQRAGGHPGTVRVDADPELTLAVDRLRLERAVTNLVDNARAHGRAPIDLGAELRGEVVALSVRDHGDGFPPGFIERAFERFARPDEGRSGGGTGLGLAIVRAIALAHGGSVSAENAEPGARVTISLPAPA